MTYHLRYLKKPLAVFLVICTALIPVIFRSSNDKITETKSRINLLESEKGKNEKQFRGIESQLNEETEEMNKLFLGFKFAT